MIKLIGYIHVKSLPILTHTENKQENRTIADIETCGRCHLIDTVNELPFWDTFIQMIGGQCG